MLDIEYLPRHPTNYNPPIGLIGCGGITVRHLKAYRDAGFQVVALCDLQREAAEARAAEFFPAATIFTDYRNLLRSDEIEVVDVATHPPNRPSIVRDCLLAGKHVLSQKPFVLDLDVGEELVELAAKQNCKLAVNQNGRWAPHFSYARAAVAAGLLGDLSGVHMSVHWDHTWTKGTEFEHVKHLILYDFAIHWFDMISCLFEPTQPKRVFASTSRTKRQEIAPALLGQALVEFDHAQASLAFDADTGLGPEDGTYITGSRGTISSTGPSLQDQRLTIHYLKDGEEASYRPDLQGTWFPVGFHGTMGELLCSIDENRPPTIDAARNLQSLCFVSPQSPVRSRTSPSSQAR